MDSPTIKELNEASMVLQNAYWYMRRKYGCSVATGLINSKRMDVLDHLHSLRRQRKGLFTWLSGRKRR